MEKGQVDYQYDNGASRPTKKSSSKKLWIILVVLVFLALIIATGLYVYSEFVTKKPSSDPNPAVTSIGTEKKAEVLSAEDTLKGLADTLRATGIGYGGTIQPYKVAGFEFKTSVGVETRSVTVSRSPGESATALSAARDYLKTKNYKENIVEKGIGSSSFIANYESEKAICRAEHIKAASGSNLSLDTVSLSCLDISDLKKIAESQKPFYELLKAARPDEIVLDKVAIAGNPKIDDSYVYGYKTVEQALISGADDTSNRGGTVMKAMFYQTPDGHWHYFTTTDGLVDCDLYKTDDLKRAYKAKPCLDTEDSTQYVGLTAKSTSN